MKWLKNLFGSKEPAKNAVVSTATLQREPGDVYVIRISGLFSKGTMDKIQAIGAQAFEKGAKDIKVLFVTRDFKGWQRGDNWEDLDFFAQYGDEIARIAVVGDARWKEEMLLFLAAGQRKGEVRYFLPGDEAKARAWLG
jgi:hypothetical protein